MHAAACMPETQCLVVVAIDRYYWKEKEKVRI